MNWIEIKIKTKREAVDAVSNIFYEAGTKGVVIEDPKDYLQRSENSWDYLDIPEYLDIDSDDVIVTGYLVEDSSIGEKIRHIENRLKGLSEFGLDAGKGEIQTNIIADTDWTKAWKKYYKPTLVGKNIVICPSWETFNDNEKIVITLDPGMAFGTGTHETTAMCLELLENYTKKGSVVIDMGCGSGVLSIAAAKLGAKKVLAIDKDDVACRTARENIKLNGLRSKIQVINRDSLEGIDVKADLIVANIIADTIVELCPSIYDHLKDNGIFIASGIIQDNKLSVIKALEKNGFDVVNHINRDEWVSIVSFSQDPHPKS